MQHENDFNSLNMPLFKFHTSVHTHIQTIYRFVVSRSSNERCVSSDFVLVFSSLFLWLLRICYDIWNDLLNLDFRNNFFVRRPHFTLQNGVTKIGISTYRIQNECELNDFRSLCAHIVCITIVCACQIESQPQKKIHYAKHIMEKPRRHVADRERERERRAKIKHLETKLYCNGCEKIQNDSRWWRLMRHQRLEPNFVCKQITPRNLHNGKSNKRRNTPTEHITKYKNRIVTFRS